MRHLLAALAVSLLAAACTTPQSVSLKERHRVPLQGTVKGPIFYAQETKQCGPAALAMVLAHSGVPVEPRDLVEEVYNPGREGSLTPAVLAAARRHGRIAYPINSLEALLQEVSQGKPVLVLQNLGLQWYPLWHYAVVIGYDLERETVTLHSGKTEFHVMPLDTFEMTWARSEHWGLMTLRPEEFPASADKNTYLKSVAGVERAGQTRVAADAYKTAVDRWPDNLVAWMGLGNTLYGLGEKRAAADAFRSASILHPDSADAFNNLAHVLAGLGALDEAERAGRTAVALGGRNIETYRKTLNSILNTRPPDKQARL